MANMYPISFLVIRGKSQGKSMAATLPTIPRIGERVNFNGDKFRVIDIESELRFMGNNSDSMPTYNAKYLWIYLEDM